MSVEHYIACDDCKKALWAGCDGLFQNQFLYNNPVEMKALGEFLYAHRMHRLRYLLEQYVYDDGFEMSYADGTVEPPSTPAERP